LNLLTFWGTQRTSLNSFSSVETLLKWRELPAKTAYMRLFCVEKEQFGFFKSNPVTYQTGS
jgi:hypothetical protein